ncbi:WxL domain-containing protein [Enterococcus sp. AZ012]|uniref:WxL domain-containing protein n=1 Tax=unclassified Enterococcus TaxID=2608891 RepID=UPI003D2A5CA0
MLYKKLISSSIILATLGAVGLGSLEVYAQDASSQGILSILEVTDPVAPPVDPDEGDDGGGVVDPGEPSSPGEIGISKVTDWQFGTLENYDPSLGATMVASRVENNTFNHVIVDDKREDSGSWSLSVSSDAFKSGDKSLTGTTIKLNSLSANNYNQTASFGGPSSLQLLQDNESMEVVTAIDGADGFTTISLGEVELSIPKHQNIAEGEEYTSVITWNLTAEPA